MSTKDQRAKWRQIVPARIDPENKKKLARIARRIGMLTYRGTPNYGRVLDLIIEQFDEYQLPKAAAGVQVPGRTSLPSRPPRRFPGLGTARND